MLDKQLPTGQNRPRVLMVTKNGHRYLFRYHSGQERELYFRLIDCARDPATEVSWPEVFVAMEHIAPFSITLTPEQ